jgi:hypothetical protein
VNTYPCGCPKRVGHRIRDRELHLRWHELVVEQGGPAGRVDAYTLRDARGIQTISPGSVGAKIVERNERTGKSSPGWRRKASRG